MPWNKKHQKIVQGEKKYSFILPASHSQSQHYLMPRRNFSARKCSSHQERGGEWPPSPAFQGTAMSSFFGFSPIRLAKLRLQTWWGTRKKSKVLISRHTASTILVHRYLLCRKIQQILPLTKPTANRTAANFASFCLTDIHIHWCHRPKSFTTHVRAQEPYWQPTQASVASKV